MKIYITGCAKSGTTLLKDLFKCFVDTEVIDKELTVDEFLERQSQSKFLVAKRNIVSVLANCLPTEEAERQLGLLRAEGIKVITVLRNGEDVIESGYVSPERWMCSLYDYLEYREYVSAVLRYEDLVRHPDILQNWFSRLWGLEALKRFSDCSIRTDRVNKGFKVESKDMLEAIALLEDHVPCH